MHRFTLLALVLIAVTTRAAAQERGQLDSSPTLFTVLAAMDAASIGIDADSPSNHPLRKAVRDEIAKQNVGILPELKHYFSIHRQKNDALELSQYISWALTVGGPPDFSVRNRTVDLAPDVAPLSDFSDLVAAFYKQAGIENLFRRSQPAIEQYLGRYHAGAADAVLQVNTYLRQQTSGFHGRHFQIYVELLGPPNQIQTRSYANEYTVVLTPTTQPQINDIRHAYLHYLLDPLATRYQEVVLRKRGLGDHAQRAPALADSYKEDFLLLATESLIKAVEARLDRKPVLAAEALKEGYILTPFFSEALPVFEKQEQAMLFYFEEMVKAIELKKEDERLRTVEFNKESRVRAVKSAPAPPPPPLTGAARTLELADEAYTARELDKAKQQYLAVLQQTDSRPMHAQAYYGLARVAALQKDPEVAERLFQKTLESSPEPSTKAWTLVYLGRLAEAAGELEQAAQRYRDALAVNGVSEKAREAAAQALEKQKPNK